MASAVPVILAPLHEGHRPPEGPGFPPRVQMDRLPTVLLGLALLTCLPGADF